MENTDKFNALIDRANLLNRIQSKIVLNQSLRPTQAEIEAAWEAAGFELPIDEGAEITWVTDSKLRQLLTILPKDAFSPTYLNFPCYHAIPSPVNPNEILTLFDTMSRASASWPLAQDTEVLPYIPKVDMSGNNISRISHPYRRTPVKNATVETGTGHVHKSPIWNETGTLIYYIAVLGTPNYVGWPLTTQIYSINPDGTDETLVYTAPANYYLDRIQISNGIVYAFGKETVSNQAVILAIEEDSWGLVNVTGCGFTSLMNTTSSAAPTYPFDLAQFTLLGDEVIFLDYENGLIKTFNIVTEDVSIVKDLDELGWKHLRTGLGNFQLIAGHPENTYFYLQKYQLSELYQSLDYGVAGLDYQTECILQIHIDGVVEKTIYDSHIPMMFYINEELPYVLCNPARLGVYPNKFVSPTTGMAVGISKYIPEVPDFKLLYEKEAKDGKSLSQFLLGNILDDDVIVDITKYKHLLIIFAGSVQQAIPTNVSTIDGFSISGGVTRNYEINNGTVSAVVTDNLDLPGSLQSLVKHGMVSEFIPFYTYDGGFIGNGTAMAASMGQWNAATGEIRGKFITSINLMLQTNPNDFFTKYSRIKVYGFAPSSEFTTGEEYDEPV